MRDGEDQVLHVALKRMRKICRIIKCCFMVATIMSALIWVIVVATLLVGWLKSGQEMAALFFTQLHTAHSLFLSCGT